MRTVGIITTYRQPNFGSVLQAYALQRVIDKLGYRSQVIDYKYPNSYHFKHGHPINGKSKGFMSKAKRWVKQYIHLIFEWLGLRPVPKMKLLNKFINDEMNCTRQYRSYNDLHQHSPIFDIYVSGSDQIWNPNEMYGDMSYFYDFVPDGSKIISYSSSFSCDAVPEKYQKQYKHYLSRFTAISVRETNGINLVEELTGRKDAKLVLDPTLLLDKNEWMQLAQKSRKLKTPKKFILCYMLAYTYDPNEKMKELLKFVQMKYNLPIVSLSPLKDWDGGEYIRIEHHQSIGNYEFLRLFAEAEIIITSSFHGTAFSLNFGKPFLALQNGKSNADDRISSLLYNIEMQSQLIKTNTVLNEDISPYYDYNEEQIQLISKRNESIAFLEYSLTCKEYDS